MIMNEIYRIVSRPNKKWGRAYFVQSKIESVAIATEWNDVECGAFKSLSKTRKFVEELNIGEQIHDALGFTT